MTLISKYWFVPLSQLILERGGRGVITFNNVMTMITSWLALNDKIIQVLYTVIPNCELNILMAGAARY